jgi:hypothetical protein
MSNVKLRQLLKRVACREVWSAGGDRFASARCFKAAWLVAASSGGPGALGIVVGLLPGLPRTQLDSELILAVFVPAVVFEFLPPWACCD